MPKEPHGYYDTNMSEEEFQRRQAAKAKRRKKRRTQKMMLIGAFILAAVLLLVAIIAIFSAIFGGSAPSSSSVPSSVSSAPAPVSSAPLFTYPTAADPTEWSLKLVNGNHALPDGFEMQEGTGDGQLGTIVQNGVAYYFDNRIIDPLSRMMADCNEQVEGGSLAIISGYRGWGTQQTRWSDAYSALVDSGQTPEMAAVLVEAIEQSPGQSEHQIGLAVDFVTGIIQTPAIEFASTPEFLWLMDNAAAYGFIIRYPSEKENITGVTVQPYHFRYVGEEHARAIKGAAISLEEYLVAVPEAPEDAGDVASAAE